MWEVLKVQVGTSLGLLRLRLRIQEPWPSCKGKRLAFRRLWVRIPAPYTGWTFFTYCKNCNVCLKRPKINEKEAGVGPLFKKKNPLLKCNQLLITGLRWPVASALLQVEQRGFEGEVLQVRARPSVPDPVRRLQKGSQVIK